MTLKLPQRLIICLIALLPITVNAQKQLDSIMQLAHKRGIFNGNLLIAQHGRIIYERSFGYADGTRTRPLTGDLKFDIGSVSKEFNGASILLLTQRGLLGLDDPIAKYLPELPKWAQQVQIKHLISYTSGIPVADVLSAETDSTIRKSLLQLKELKFQPGTAYIYNHYNVYLQMRLIEKVSGMAYADFLRKNIFLPCKMSGAAVDMPVSDPKMAKAFDLDGRNTLYAQSMSGWVRLTARDLYRWSEALQQNKLLTKASFKQLAANFPNGESSIGTTGFAGDSLLWHRHQGSNSNYEALLYSDLKRGLTVVLMTNNQQMKVDGIKNALFAAISGQPINVPKRSVYLAIRERTLANVDSGLHYYRQIRSQQQDIFELSFEAGDLISTGKYLLRRNKFDDAIRIFAEASPLCAKAGDRSYAYELTAESHLKKGDRQQARSWYEQAMTADPANQNAKGMLAQLKE
ncbi:serine hydrolase [Mucilaginibacter myungsuensis]|uniref:Serine hydrolase n=1 Tax=Mucilaginibacter myungsuensis TaxID=649104 RepID=A0A929KT98_9SPHI|nr:serine hydrolase [Mucilaginibacter myungsuensis]MBE9660762.1 serine hydrolase [Mucilaginibacter myungsuensis]MDN3600807.1 serine hydrolase [Mucilaginibacter myungsuensis]